MFLLPSNWLFFLFFWFSLNRLFQKHQPVFRALDRKITDWGNKCDHRERLIIQWKDHPAWHNHWTLLKIVSPEISVKKVFDNYAGKIDESNYYFLVYFYSLLIKLFKLCFSRNLHSSKVENINMFPSYYPFNFLPTNPTDENCTIPYLVWNTYIFTLTRGEESCIFKDRRARGLS